MAAHHISEAEASADFAAVMARVRSGIEVIIESNAQPIAVVRAPDLPRRTIEECIALLPEHSSSCMDEDFARDVEVAIQSHRDPLDPPAWP
jgi:antitoxin (DNA-binding transcriptional repressor) of toxin-antitoxin stability system